MKLAIMQPYFFPYIGYFQLIQAVDKFVFYDDVNFIKQGWINRNRILLNNKDFLFSIPLEQISSNKKINETKISKKYFEKWLTKFYKTINSAYNKAAYFNDTLSLLEKTFEIKHATISELAIESITNVCNYLGVEKEFEVSSKLYQETFGLSKSGRLIEICKKNNTKQYINPIGGQAIYTKEEFAKSGIKLSFLQSNNIRYNQFGNKFVPGLSIIDILMFNSVDEIKEMLSKYKLI